MWKKKYFHEKKKTPPLEERIVFLKDELEQIHKRTIQNIDGETKHAIQMGYTKEAEVGVILYLFCLLILFRLNSLSLCSFP